MIRNLGSSLVRPVAAAMLALPLLTAAPSHAEPAQSPRTVAAAETSLSKARYDVLRYTNNHRRANGLQPLKFSTCLNRKVAQPWAVRMARTGNFTHRDLGTVSSMCPTFRGVAENIAAGQRTARDVVTAWIQSPGHRANILNPNYKRIAIGYKVSANGSPYWVQNFGS